MTNPDYRAGGPGPGGAVSPNPTTQLILGIVNTIFCCLPLGIVAIVFAALAMGRVNDDPADASSKAGTARTLNYIGIGLGLLIIVIWIILAITGAVAAPGAGDLDTGGFEGVQDVQVD